MQWGSLESCKYASWVFHSVSGSPNIFSKILNTLYIFQSPSSCLCAIIYLCCLYLVICSWYLEFTLLPVQRYVPVFWVAQRFCKHLNECLLNFYFKYMCLISSFDLLGNLRFFSFLLKALGFIVKLSCGDYFPHWDFCITTLYSRLSQLFLHWFFLFF